MTDIDSMSIPYPYLVVATDKYYGVTFSNDGKQIRNKKKNRKNFESGKQKKLRILLTTYWDYPVVGGLQNYITTLKKGLEKLGHIVDVFASNSFSDNSKGLKKRITEETKRFYKDRYKTYSNKIVKENCRLSLYEMNLRELDLEKYDIFHAQDRFTAIVLGRVNEEYKKPLLFTPHGFMTQRRLDLGMLDQGTVEEAYFLSLDQKAIEVSDKVITLCEVFRPVLKKLGAKDDKITTVYTGIDVKLETKKTSKITKKNRTVITCISRLRPRKGHKYLFEALASIKGKLKNVEVWIVGDGEVREELEDQVEALNLKEVKFLGERKDIEKLLSQSDIFILPTTSDTLPLAIIEAMFANKAIISTRIGGIPEIIQNGHTGLLTDPGNSKQLAEKILSLLGDSALRERIAANATSYAEKNLRSSTMVKRIEAIYHAFLKGVNG